MEYRFKADEWKSLSTVERVRRCRLMAAQAQALADGAPSEVKSAYAKIASDWLQLATEIERSGEGSS